MITPRKFFGSTIADGLLYVVGGVSDTTVVSSTEMYDPDLDVWTVRSSLSSPRNGMAVVAIDDDFILSIGGAENDLVDTVELFDIQNNLWTLRSPLPSPRGGMAAVVLDNRVFVMGGTISHPSSGLRVTASVLSYDLKEDEWTERRSMNVARAAHCAVVIRDKIFVVGGSQLHDDSLDEILLSSVESYDEFNDVWVLERSLPFGLSHASCSSLDSRILVFGGSGASSSSSLFLRDTVLSSHPFFDPSDETFLLY